MSISRSAAVAATAVAATFAVLGSDATSQAASNPSTAKTSNVVVAAQAPQHTMHQTHLIYSWPL